MDIMFRLFRKEFTTATSTLQFLVDKPSSNVPFDLLNLITAQVELANTSVNYSFLSEKSTGGLTNYYSVNPNEDYYMTDGDGRRVLNPTTGNTSFILKTVMSTTNPHISPIIDITRFGGIFVENIINNLPLSNSDINITNGGTGYSTNANAVVTISAPTGANGSLALASAIVTNNVITSVYLTSVGSGYITSPTITITDANTTPGTGATIVYNGEDKKSGGNAATRYIMRRVSLADGFDSGDLRVYLSGYKPSGSDILVYYKLLSKSDSETFDTKDYQLMTQLDNINFVSTFDGDYREITFAPGVNNIANNSVTYTTSSSAFNSFKTFAIKIVMTGTNTTDVPKVQDVRVIALPAV
jgi:hypothetical protein